MVLINEKKTKKDIDPKYDFLRQIRSNTKNVEIYDFEADTVVLYSSIYKAALAGVISMYDGKVWRTRYAVT